MDKKLKEKWVKALRSGKYKQGKGVLRTADNRYCCLGVLADVLGVKWPKETTLIGTIINGDTSEVKAYMVEEGGTGLDYQTRERIGLGNEQGALIEMNDTGKRFSTIADYIEKNL